MFNLSQIESFKKIVDLNTLIIVEGKKDKKALSYLGLKNILEISGKSLEKTVNLIKSRNPESVLILTDFDDEGEKYSKELIKIIQFNGIKSDQTFRKKFKSIFKIMKIEELNSFKKILDEDYDNGNSSIYAKAFNRKRFLRHLEKVSHRAV